jgi:hypothetical protein
LFMAAKKLRFSRAVSRSATVGGGVKQSGTDLRAPLHVAPETGAAPRRHWPGWPGCVIRGWLRTVAPIKAAISPAPPERNAQNGRMGQRRKGLRTPAPGSRYREILHDVSTTRALAATFYRP